MYLVYINLTDGRDASGIPRDATHVGYIYYIRVRTTHPSVRGSMTIIGIYT